jgi:hemoglobin
MSRVSMRAFWLGGAVAVGLSLAACADNEMKMHEQSLYTRLGGKPAITAVVDEFIGNVAADKRINAFFANADIPDLKGKLVDLICQGTGGPCTYAGKDMKAAQKAGRKEGDLSRWSRTWSPPGQIQGAGEGEGRAARHIGANEGRDRRGVSTLADRAGGATGRSPYDPTRPSHSSSLRVVSPSSFALAAFEPASAPTMT